MLPLAVKLTMLVPIISSRSKHLIKDAGFTFLIPYSIMPA